MIPDHIKEQMKAGEGLHTEFKRDATDLDAIAKAVCGFLNSKGGSVFCGLDNSGTIVGLPAYEGLARRVHDYLLKVITPPPLLSVNADDEAGKHILTVEVPEGKDRPYVCGGSVYVRRGDQTVAADSQTLRDMVQLKAVSPERWERRPSMGMDEGDLDREELARMVAQAQQSGRFTFEAPDDTSAVLRSLGMYLAQGFTQGADVLFARNPAQRHPQTRVRLTRFGAGGKVGDWYFDSRQLQGPLVKVSDQLFETVSSHVPTEARFEAGRPRRDDRPAFPLDAIREGLINALAHRDYAGFSGGVSVGIHDDRIEIWNSGRLPEGITPGDLRSNHPSLPTNPDIAQVFYVRGLMERIGRGTQKIVQACKDRGLRPPQWKDEPSGVTLTLFGPVRPGANLELNTRQQALVAGTASGERFRLAEYRERFAPDVTERQARRDLQALEQQGVLRREGEGRGTSYVRLNRT